MRQVQGDYIGVYRAYVTSNKDPLEIGRVQVRVPFMHGVPGTNMKYIRDENLPYATPCFPSASYDSGTFMIPEVGSIVFVLFEDGDSHKPIYLGQCLGKADDNTVKMYGYPDSDMFKESDGLRQKRAIFDETIPGVYNKGIPRKTVVYKSSKGQSIEINDNDEQENIAIYDRLGQVFLMSAPDTKLNSAYGVLNRGLFSVLKNKFSRVIEKTCLIILKSLSGSKLRFVSNSKYSSLDLLNVYRDDVSGISVNIGRDNRLLVFYKDTKLELSEDSITLNSDNINIVSKEVNISSDVIHSSSEISIGTSKKVEVNPYKDSNIEETVIE